MMLALMASLLGAAPVTPAAPTAASDDPPIKVWLNQDSYFQRGDKAKVHVKLADDGYLVVLRTDAEGRVRVLFPLDPTGDDFVRGGNKLEVRGRGDREAFSIDEREGTGVVLAARSVAPFKFDEFVRGDHWDYRVLDARSAGDDKEAALVDLVQRMVPDGHFDYDAQKYFISAPRAYYDSYYPSYGVGFGYGWPYYGYRFGFGFGYNSCFDPFFYDPFFCQSAFYSPFFYNPFFYSPYVYVYRPFIYRPFGYRPFVYAGGLARGGLYFKNPPGTNPPFGGVGPRQRIPQGVVLTRAVGSTPVRGRDGARGLDRPAAPEPRDRGGDVARPAPSRGRDPGVSGGDHSSGGSRSSGGRGWSSGGSGGGGGRSAPAGRSGGWSGGGGRTGGGGSARSGGGGGGGGGRRH